MHNAKARLSELVAAAEAGEDVVIARGGTPAVRLVPVRVEHPAVRLGVLAGQIELSEDVDEPLPEFAPVVSLPGRETRCVSLAYCVCFDCR